MQFSILTYLFISTFHVLFPTASPGPDLDFLTNASPQAVESMFANTLYTQQQRDRDIWFVATRNPNPATLQAFIHSGANPNSRNLHGDTLLHAIVYEKPVEIIIVLIQNGADVTATNPYAETPLHRAAEGNHSVTVIQALLDAGADINARDEYNETPLIRAVRFNENPEIARFLLHSGADRTVTDTNNRTAYDFAKERDIFADSEVLELLKP